MDVNLEYYKIFYYIGKTGGITTAAKELSISQPAVSQALKQLEGWIGTPLFVRTPKGVRFTKEGEVLYQHISKGYEAMKKGEHLVLQMMNLEAGEIHIGASDMTLRYYLLPYLQSFHEKYPDIKITVTNGPTPETIQYLADGRIDFGVVTTPLTLQEGYEIKPVKSIVDAFVAGEKFRRWKDKTLAFLELEKLPLLSLEKNTSTRRYMDEFLRENGVIFQPEFELATSDILVQFALKNMGVACVMKEFAKEYLESGELFELRFEKPIPQREICIITDKERVTSTAAKGLLEMLR